MDGIREYLIGVIAAAVLCGIVKSLLGNNGTVGIAVRLLCGLLMILAVIRPWTDLSLDGILDWADSITADGSGMVAEGNAMANEAYRESIKQQTEAYILDESRVLGCELTVEVRLSQDEIPVPEMVWLTGETSPYARQTLTNLITERLGIEREDQIWT